MTRRPLRTRPLCARCGAELWPGWHWCYGSWMERKLKRARLECGVDAAMEKPVEIREIKE